MPKIKSTPLAPIDQNEGVFMSNNNAVILTPSDVRFEKNSIQLRDSI